jgi:pimeloyl-ACP methyl ester carboxylesterase
MGNNSGVLRQLALRGGRGLAHPQRGEHGGAARRCGGYLPRIIESNGIRLNIAEQGEGPLVLLAHGFPESWYSWRHQIGALAAGGFHVVARDSPDTRLSTMLSNGVSLIQSATTISKQPDFPFRADAYSDAG